MNADPMSKSKSEYDLTIQRISLPDSPVGPNKVPISAASHRNDHDPRENPKNRCR
jgi:hypothetical protein